MSNSRGGFYGSHEIERVREAVDIHTVVGRFVELKRTGRNYKGLCPFHTEKTPSFFVSPEKQTYHCFGCGVGGDIYSFLMKYLGLSFRDALEELASEAGIVLTTENRDTSSGTDMLREILGEAHSYFVRMLSDKKGSKAREYLASRSISESAIGKLGIGWAPGGSRLTDFLRKAGYSTSQLIESGLSVESVNQHGGAYDRFRERLIFPIQDRRGRPVSFGGRIIETPPDGVPKYLNGPESPIYTKSNILYGYRDALKSARDLDMIILVEGYFDHARFFEAGFKCVSATCGTALTHAQARHLKSAPGEIIICYDGDKAGQKAAVLASEVILEEGALSRIVAIPDGNDPDDYILLHGAEGILRLIEDAKDPISYALELLGGWKSVGSTRKQVLVVRRLVEIASRSSSPVMEKTLMRVISEQTGYTLSVLEAEANGVLKKRVPRKKSNSTGDQLSSWDIALLKALLSSPAGYADDLLNYLGQNDFRSGIAKEIFDEMKLQTANGYSSISLAAMKEEQASLCSSLLTDAEPLDSTDRERLIKSVAGRRLENRLHELSTSLADATDDEKIKIQEDIRDTGKELMKVRNAGKTEL